MASTREPSSEGETSLEVLAEHLWMLVPGLLVIYLGFDAGGFFAGTTGAAGAAIAVLLAIRVLTAPSPFSGLTPFGIVALVGIAGLAALSLVSQVWSHAPARALLSFDLAALYLAVTALCSGVQQPANRLRTMIYGLLVGLAAVCGAGLLSRTLPQVFPVASGFLSQRLSYPVTYWNALGMLAALGIVLAVHVSSDRDGPAPARILSTGLIPAFGATVLLTFSRGAIASLAVALVLYVVLAPRLTLMMTAVVAAPLSAIAVHATYDASLLGSSYPTTPAAVQQGHHVAIVVALCVVGACALRAVVLFGERRLPAVAMPRWAWLAPAAAAIVAAAVLASTSHWISREYHQFAGSAVAPVTGPARARLTSGSNNGRLELWRVAWKGFEAEPLRGSGAGTYVLLWERNRPILETVQDAHSLYLQTLAELGILGAIALAMFLLGLLFGAVRLIRNRRVGPMAALAAASLIAWALHSAVDWDWEMPVVMVPVLALVAAVSASARSRSRSAPPLAARGFVGLCCLVLGVAPALVAISQADLDASVRAFERSDCRTALAGAQAAHGVVGWRPEPLEIIGYCETAHRGDGARAVSTMKSAVKRDPGDWEFHYALAIATAADGVNPLPELRNALRLDPQEGLITSAIAAFRGAPRDKRRPIALRTPLDVQ